MDRACNVWKLLMDKEDNSKIILISALDFDIDNGKHKLFFNDKLGTTKYDETVEFYHKWVLKQDLETEDSPLNDYFYFITPDDSKNL
jgi:hypothetical protein